MLIGKKNMATRGQDYFALYGYSGNLKNVRLRSCMADFQIIVKIGSLCDRPSIIFLQAMLIDIKIWLPGGGAVLPYSGNFKNLLLKVSGPFSKLFV